VPCRPTFPYLNCTDYSFASSTFALGLVTAQSSSYTSTTSNGVTTTTSSSSFVAVFQFYHVEALSTGTCTQIIEQYGVDILKFMTTTTCMGNVDVYINGVKDRKSGVSMASGYPVLNVQVQCPNPIGYNVSEQKALTAKMCQDLHWLCVCLVILC
jgi:formylmethanofuran dehydrogenase subunit C